MIEALLLVRVVQFVLSSAVVFGATALLIEAGLFIGRIKNSRIRSLFRYVPILKLPLDFSFYILSLCVYFTNFNPFSCFSCIEGIVVKVFLLDVPKDSLHPLADFLTAHVPVWGLKGALIAIGVSFGGVIAYKLFSVARAYKSLRQTCLTAGPSMRKIGSIALQEALNKQKVEVLISDETLVPSAALGRYILFSPIQEKLLSQEEFESVVAHELEHLRWSDPLLKWSCFFIGSIFWWLPTRAWLKRLEEDQEFASDASVHQYGLTNHALASAIVKISKDLKQRSVSAPICYLNRSRSLGFKRVAELLNNVERPSLRIYLRRSLWVMALALVLLVTFRVC